MLGKYGIRYTVTRPDLTTKFWSPSKSQVSDTSHPTNRIMSVCEEYGGVWKYYLAPNGLSFFFDCIFDDEKSRQSFADSFKKLLEDENDFALVEERNNYQEEHNIKMNVEFF